jgi:protein transport protein SEC20
MRANNDVTEALRRTIGLMQGELERSVLSTQMLGPSLTRLHMNSSAIRSHHRRLHCNITFYIFDA